MSDQDALKNAALLDVYFHNSEAELDGFKHKATLANLTNDQLLDVIHHLFTQNQRRTRDTKYQPVLQNWVMKLPRMQQSVLLSAIRNMDGIPKGHPMKVLVRFYRRCILMTAFEGLAINNPFTPGGGNFTGPSLSAWVTSSEDAPIFRLPDNGDSMVITEDWTMAMNAMVVDPFIREHESADMHYFFHLLHAIQIVGYKHPSRQVREWWNSVYCRVVDVFHLHPESEEEMDLRLSDSKEDWLARTDSSTL